MRSVIQCRTCGVALSKPLELLADSRQLSEEDGKDHVAVGHLWISDGTYFTGTEGAPLINEADGISMRNHPDRRRWSGCCGPSGDEGPNLLCTCGHEVATLKGDCWLAHAVVFVTSEVTVATE